MLILYEIISDSTLIQNIYFDALQSSIQSNFSILIGKTYRDMFFRLYRVIRKHLRATVWKELITTNSQQTFNYLIYHMYLLYQFLGQNYSCLITQKTMEVSLTFRSLSHSAHSKCDNRASGKKGHKNSQKPFQNHLVIWKLIWRFYISGSF